MSPMLDSWLVRFSISLGVFAGLGGQAAARPMLDDPHMGQLSQYQVLVFADRVGGGLDRGKAIGVIDATPEEVFRVATDCSKYKEFMPRVFSSEVVKKRQEETVVRIDAELP